MNRIIRAIKRTYARKTGRVVNLGKHGVYYARKSGEATADLARGRND